MVLLLFLSNGNTFPNHLLHLWYDLYSLNESSNNIQLSGLGCVIVHVAASLKRIPVKSYSMLFLNDAARNDSKCCSLMDGRPRRSWRDVLLPLFDSQNSESHVHFIHVSLQQFTQPYGLKKTFIHIDISTCFECIFFLHTVFVHVGKSLCVYLYLCAFSQACSSC